MFNLFEPTQGCPHLQPLELMAMAEKTSIDSGNLPNARKDTVVEITEITPQHMFKVIKTQMKWNGHSWLVFHIDRFLDIENHTSGSKILN